MPSINISHTQGKETKAQLFTRPLRGVLGGKEFTLGADEGKKIMKVWQRAMLAPVLFTIGLPYTAVAGAILMCSKPKNTQSASSTIIKAPIENELSPEDMKALGQLFNETNIDLKEVEVSHKLYEVDLGKKGGAEEHFQEMLQLDQPTLMKLKFNKTDKTYDNLIIPIEMKNDEGKWVRSVCMFRHHSEDRKNDASWTCRLGKSPSDAELPLFQSPDEDSIQHYRDLLSGEVITKEGVQFRLLNAVEEAPIEKVLSPEDIEALSSYFEGTNIQLKDVEISKDLFTLDLSVLGGADNYLEQAIQLNQPTLTKVDCNGTCYDSLIIPIEYKNEDGDWVRGIWSAVHHPDEVDENACWAISVNMFNGVDLPLHGKPDPAKIKPYIDLMKGDIVTLEDIEFRLYPSS